MREMDFIFNVFLPVIRTHFFEHQLLLFIEISGFLSKWMRTIQIFGDLYCKEAYKQLVHIDDDKPEQQKKITDRIQEFFEQILML